MNGRIQAQTIDRRAPDRGQSDDLARSRRCIEVRAPIVRPRVEKSHTLASRGVDGIEQVRFEQVAGTAGKREIVIRVGPAARTRDEVFHFESEIEHDFRRAAVFTAMNGAMRDGSVPRSHFPTASLRRRDR